MPPPRKPDPLQRCVHCGALLARKRMASGVLEALLHFGRRKYCDRACMAAAYMTKTADGTPPGKRAGRAIRSSPASAPATPVRP